MGLLLLPTLLLETNLNGSAPELKGAWIAGARVDGNTVEELTLVVSEAGR
jgi:hypothetical protein